MGLDHPVFDCDNHYYEALDAFTRHLDPKLGPRTVQWAEIDGRKYHVVGGKVSRAVVNPTFDPVAKAGALASYFRGNPDGKNPIELMREREPIPAEYRDRDARVACIERFGLDGVWLFPTLGVLYEELLKHDVEAVVATFTAFNRWIEEDWGFDYKDRIFAAPYLTLADLDWACSELEWALERGARVVVMRPAAAWTANGPFSPSDERFDPFWARLNEAGVTLVIHAGDSGYTSHGYARDGFSADVSGGGWKPSIKAFHIERAALDFLATITFEKLFERFPRLRVASVENGSGFLADLFVKLEQSKQRMRWYYKEDPAEQLGRVFLVIPGHAHLRLLELDEEIAEEAGSILDRSDAQIREPLEHLVEGEGQQEVVDGPLGDQAGNARLAAASQRVERSVAAVSVRRVARAPHVGHDRDARFVHARPEGIEALVAVGAPAVLRADGRGAHHDEPRVALERPLELAAGPVHVGEREVGRAEQLPLVREPPVLLEPAVEALGQHAEGLDVVGQGLLVEHAGRGEEPGPGQTLLFDAGDARVAVHVLGRHRLERGTDQVGEGLALRVAAVVLAQHAGLRDRIEGGVAHGVVQLAGDQVVPLAVHLHPLHAPPLHALGHVAHEGVFRLVVVVVAVEEGTVVARHDGLLGSRR